MEIEDLKDDRYYCFGARFLKNGRVDCSKLASELEEAEYYYAMMAFECGDVGFNARLTSQSPAVWIFESSDDYEATEAEFRELLETEQFKKFAEVAPGKVQAALGALQSVDEAELKAHGVKKSDVDRIVNNSLRIVTIVRAGFKNPKMKQLPK